MRELRLYGWMDKAGVRNYRAKVMLMAFIGTHVPLITLVAYFALRSSADWRSFIATIGVTLVATLVGTGVTLLVLNHLLRPVTLASTTLRAYVRSRHVGSLPTHYTDEVGTLMADTAETLAHLERVRDALENVDATTGLANRRKLMLDIAPLRDTKARFAVCVIRFTNHGKLVETFDLKTAEAAVSTIATRLRAALDEGAALYRIGNGEFAWLAKGDDATDGTAAAVTLGTRVQDIIARCTGAVMLNTIAIEPVLRGGVTTCLDDADDPAAMVDHAFAAVAQASDDMPVSFHSPAARRVAVERLQLEQELRRALTNDEFVLHYQPVVDLSEGRAIGAEALIRWQHPQKGMIPPMKFIALAESSGLIDPMGLWVMRKACLQARAWNDAGLPGMKVAINLSARQFLDTDLVGHVDQAIRASGIAADQLEIELTETAAMADHAHTKAVFGKLRDLGVSIAIDDFGTGYASMSYLRKLPFDKLKIDREFVSNVHRIPDSQAICSALVTLAKGLGLRILAEGTEDLDEARFLWSRGCDLYQGFYFSRPLAPEQFMDGLHSVSASALALVARPDTRPDAGRMLLAS